MSPGQASDRVLQRRREQTIKDILQAQDARYVHYDELLKNAFEAYRDYTEKGKVIDRPSEVIKAIDDYDDESR